MDPARYRSVKFEPLMEENIPTLYSWLREPHIREFYHRKSVPNCKEVRADYLRRVSPDWLTRCFLSFAGAIPIGYIQAYRVADYPEYAVMIGAENGISVDLFIGDTGFLGSGWGRLRQRPVRGDPVSPGSPVKNECLVSILDELCLESMAPVQINIPPRRTIKASHEL
jgi:hypothetical protein